MSRIRISAIFLFLIFSAQGVFSFPAADSPESSYEEAILTYERFLKKKMGIDQVPGLTIGFIKDDFTWVKGYGFADLENAVPAGPESSYRLASITKPFTAVAVLRLMEEGKIDLDAEIQRYVPYFPKKKWPVTVRQLLGHLGGISHYQNPEQEENFKEPMNTRKAIDVFKDFKLIAEPGTAHHYSSYGFNLLGAVIEEVSGRSYEEFLRQEIFAPLQMKSARLDNPRALIPYRVRGYRLFGARLVNSEYVDISSRFSSGGLRANIPDLMKFARALMEGRLLKPATMKMMGTSMSTSKGFSTGYGMGWSVRPWRGHYHLGHGGSQPETKTRILIFPIEKFAAAFACNREGLMEIPYVRRLAELVLDENLDMSACLVDRQEQFLYDVLRSICSYGISRYLESGRRLPVSEEKAAKALRSFLRTAVPSHLKNNPSRVSRILSHGFHPTGGESAIIAGCLMASALDEKLGHGGLAAYNKKSPLDFFLDYSRTAREEANESRYPFLGKELEARIRIWKAGWDAADPSFFWNLCIDPETKAEDLGRQMRQIIADSPIYPDISSKLLQAAEYSTRMNDYERTKAFIGLGIEFYPHKAQVYEKGGELFGRWQNFEKAMELMQRAAQISPDSPTIRAKLKWLKKRTK